MNGKEFLIGVDIGGTFTDLVMIEQGSGAVKNFKVLTTPDDPAAGVLEALRQALDEVGASPSQIRRFVHATTLPTNLVLERKGARVAFITTEGFGDMFEMSRQYPSGPDRFNLRWMRPPSLVERGMTITADERMGPDGAVRRPLNIDKLDMDLARLAPLKPDSFAVCLLHAYANAGHELQIRDIIARRYPDKLVNISSEVWPEYREYERATATVLSAYVGPTLKAYVQRLEDALKSLGVPARLQIMQSNGAIMDVSEVLRRAAYTIECGPAAGVIAAAHVGREIGRPDVISFDMGGTTAKAGLVRDGKPDIAQEFRVGGRVSASGHREAGEPIRIPVVDLAEVGAGGGSIAWIDTGGHLRVGPQSAGADPGPACYMRGGVEPTVTDANVVLGYLDAGYFNGGAMRIDPDLAFKAIEEKIATPLGIPVIEAAQGIVSIANAIMGAAIRIVTLQRGIDPRDHSIVAFGGAGPLHIAQIALDFGIKEIIVPRSPGVKSAFGLLISDIAYDAVQTVMMPLKGADIPQLSRVLDELTAKVGEMMGDDIKSSAGTTVTRSLDIGFSHKAQTDPIELRSWPLTEDGLRSAEDDFRAHQLQAFGVSSADTLRIVGARVRMAAHVHPFPQERRDHAAASSDSAIKRRRKAWFDGQLVDARVYDRSLLAPGHVVEGPAIIEEPDATTICEAGFIVTVDETLNLVVNVAQEALAQGNAGLATILEDERD